MIVIATYNDAVEATTAQELLEANGIHCQLRGDLLTQTESIGNIELLVDAKNAEKAQEVLANDIGEA